MSRVPPWAWMVVFLLLLGVCAVACAPRTAPPVWSLAAPSIPAEVVAIPAPSTPAADACPVVAILPGTPLPAELGGARAAVCRGVVVDEGAILDLGQCEADRERLAAYLLAEHGARASDRALCEAVYTATWDRETEARQEARAMRWTGYGLGVMGLVVGAAIGVVAGAVAP